MLPLEFELSNTTGVREFVQHLLSLLQGDSIVKVTIRSKKL
jgi:hypothetical protein